eukprot:scaffold43239_cov28-Phaeocystis_antarctica.AAC.1
MDSHRGSRTGASGFMRLRNIIRGKAGLLRKRNAVRKHVTRSFRVSLEAGCATVGICGTVARQLVGRSRRQERRGSCERGIVGGGGISLASARTHFAARSGCRRGWRCPQKARGALLRALVCPGPADGPGR